MKTFLVYFEVCVPVEVPDDFDEEAVGDLVDLAEPEATIARPGSEYGQVEVNFIEVMECS